MGPEGRTDRDNNDDHKVLYGYIHRVCPVSNL